MTKTQPQPYLVDPTRLRPVARLLALAMSSAGAAIYMRLVWFVIPAIMIGANGAILMFCVLTGQWRTWSVLLSLIALARHCWRGIRSGQGRRAQ